MSGALRFMAVMSCLLAAGSVGAAEAPVPPATAGQIAALVAVVMAFGALGGFVDGLTSDLAFKLSFGTWSIDIGSLGDALAGATAAIAIFTVGAALFPNLDLHNFGHELPASIRIIAVSVLSGYAGVRLLNPMTRKMVEQISGDSATAAVKAARTRSDDATLSIKDGEKVLSRYDQEKAQFDQPGQFDAAIALLAKAQNSFDAALQIDPLDTEALIGSARAARRRAERRALNGEKPQDDWALALQMLTRVLTTSPKSARAYYNRACYQALLLKPGDPADQVLADLKMALEYMPSLKARAAADQDFAHLANSEAFKKLIAP